MISLTPNFDNNLNIPIYVQLYEYIKNEIIKGRIESNEKLPSIRNLSRVLNLSKTTIENAYNQLLMEGYIFSKPQSGYYTNEIADINLKEDSNSSNNNYIDDNNIEYDFENDFIDKSCFDFTLWRKYTNRILLDNNDKLLTQSLPEGEYELRKEITKYIYKYRGVKCTPDQIVIGAGIQILLNLLCILLKQINIHDIAFEDPSFHQARHIFKDNSFNILPISLEKKGININELIESTAKICYVSPSHQFPMGSTMPINKRMQLLKWAYTNDGLIIEDDYDSELRYTGRPIQSLQGLDNYNKVIYLGSFSTTMLPSLRISYMLLPNPMLSNYKKIKNNYTQSSSKLEQLTLALFMKNGIFEKHVKKLRKLYAKKSQLLISTIQKIMGNKVSIMSAESGINILLEIKTKLNTTEIAERTEKSGVKIVPISNYRINKEIEKHPIVLLSYSGIPVENIEPAVKLLNNIWFNN